MGWFEEMQNTLEDITIFSHLLVNVVSQVIRPKDGDVDNTSHDKNTLSRSENCLKGG